MPSALRLPPLVIIERNSSRCFPRMFSWSVAPPLSGRGSLRATTIAVGLRSELSACASHGAIESYGFKGSEAVLVRRYIFTHGISDVGTT